MKAMRHTSKIQKSVQVAVLIIYADQLSYGASILIF